MILTMFTSCILFVAIFASLDCETEYVDIHWNSTVRNYEWARNIEARKQRQTLDEFHGGGGFRQKQFVGGLYC